MQLHGHSDAELAGAIKKGHARQSGENPARLGEKEKDFSLWVLLYNG